MTKTHRTVVAACLISFSVSVIGGSENTPAAPFGIEMGSPGSCAALPKKLKSIDPRVSNSPEDLGGPPSSNAYSYKPMDKVFPGARANMLVMCIEGKLQLLVMAVYRGDFDSIFYETAIALSEKYHPLDGAKSLKEILAHGGQLSYSARGAFIRLIVDKGGNSFSMMYEYVGPLHTDSIKAERRREGDKTTRKNAF